jgi:hypothetical protein
MFLDEGEDLVGEVLGEAWGEVGVAHAGDSYCSGTRDAVGQGLGVGWGEDRVGLGDDHQRGDLDGCQGWGLVALLAHAMVVGGLRPVAGSGEMPLGQVAGGSLVEGQAAAVHELVHLHVGVYPLLVRAARQLRDLVGAGQERRVRGRQVAAARCGGRHQSE